MNAASKNPRASLPSYGDLQDTAVRRRDPRFVASSDVDSWLRDRRVLVSGPILTVTTSGERLALRDAVRVLGARGEVDLFGLTGRVMALAELIAMGATVSNDAARIGSAVYELQFGFLAHPIEAGRTSQPPSAS